MQRFLTVHISVVYYVYIFRTSGDEILQRNVVGNFLRHKRIYSKWEQLLVIALTFVEITRNIGFT